MQTGTASLHPKNATLGTRPPSTGQWKRKSWRVPLFRGCLLIRTGPHSAYVDIRKHKTPSHADCSPLRTSESARHSTTTSAIATRPPARMLPPDTFGTSMHLCNNRARHNPPPNSRVCPRTFPISSHGTKRPWPPASLLSLCCSSTRTANAVAAISTRDTSQLSGLCFVACKMSLAVCL